jgi:hypothetical protein
MHKPLDFEGAQPRAPYEPRREMLESTRLSRLPALPKRSTVPDFTPMPAAAVCVNCKAKLDEYNQPLAHVKACRNCLSAHAVIETEIDEADKRKRYEILGKMLGKFAPEVNDEQS